MGVVCVLRTELRFAMHTLCPLVSWEVLRWAAITRVVHGGDHESCCNLPVWAAVAAGVNSAPGVSLPSMWVWVQGWRQCVPTLPPWRVGSASF